jgi:hypothetical protein
MLGICRAWSTRCSRITILCARSFSPLHSSAPLSPFRLARSLLKKPLLLQLKPLLLQPTLLL